MKTSVKGCPSEPLSPKSTQIAGLPFLPKAVTENITHRGKCGVSFWCVCPRNHGQAMFGPASSDVRHREGSRIYFPKKRPDRYEAFRVDGFHYAAIRSPSFQHLSSPSLFDHINAKKPSKRWTFRQTERECIVPNAFPLKFYLSQRSQFFVFSFFVIRVSS